METERLILKVQVKKGSINWMFDRKFWDLIDKESKAIIGHCGFHTWDKEDRQAEIGYRLEKKFRKKGLMLEAIQPIISFGFNEMELKKIEAYIKIKNLPSIKLITKIGFVPEEEAPDLSNKNYNQYFSLLKSDYLKSST